VKFGFSVDDKSGTPRRSAFFCENSKAIKNIAANSATHPKE
jgi:hypothetical protein